MSARHKYIRGIVGSYPIRSVKEECTKNENAKANILGVGVDQYEKPRNEMQDRVMMTISSQSGTIDI